MKPPQSPRSKTAAAAGLLVVLLVPVRLPGQDKNFDEKNYYDYVPASIPKRPFIYSETEASKSLHLYGDLASPSYHDEDRDGIDDARAVRLLDIAEKFSPILRRNNHSVPRDFRKMLRLQYHEPSGEVTFGGREKLHFDQWDVTGSESVNDSQSVIDIDCIRSKAKGTDDPVCKHRCDECVFSRVLASNDLHGSDRRIARPDSASDNVLYFNFPGKDEDSWRDIYKTLEHQEAINRSVDSKIYAHFLIADRYTGRDVDNPEPERYRLVIQFWFFYPFNDGANNHEGDWEHINVHITTKESRESWMTAEQIQRLLAPDGDRKSQPLDSMILKEIDYYFHHFVFTLDFIDGKFDFYKYDKWAGIDSLLSELPKWERAKRQEMYRLTHDRLRLFDGCGVGWNTHPVAWIGANSIGPELLFGLPKERNQNSHGTYPYSGIWKDVGAAGAAEEMDDDRDHPLLKRTAYEFPLPAPERAQFVEANGDDTSLLCHPKENPLLESIYSEKLKEKSRSLIYTRNEINLIPDWERVEGMVRTDPGVAAEWYWLVLPIRWGFPAVGSIGAGLFKDVDLGNSAPVGPAFNTAWNRIGPSRGYDNYDAHHLPALWQLHVWDGFYNNGGILNLFIVVSTAPPFNLFTHIYRGVVKPRRLFTQMTPPSSFIDINGGLGFSYFDNDFAEAYTYLADTAVPGSMSIEKSGPRFWAKMSSRMLFFESGLGVEWTPKAKMMSETSDSLHHFADMSSFELMGDMTWRILPSKRFSPFALFGYGIRWIEVEDPSDNTLSYNSCDRSFSGWRIIPDLSDLSDLFVCTFWPRVWHFGGGIDLSLYKNDRTTFLWTNARPSIPDLTLRLGYKATFQRLPTDDWGTRHDLNVSMTLGF